MDGSGLGKREFTLAIVILVGFAALTVYMVSKAATGDPTWSHLVFIYSGVEAIVFSAVGAVFGVTVQRRQTMEEQNRADEAEKRAESSAADAAVGKGLAAAVRVKLQQAESYLGLDENDHLAPRPATGEQVGAISPAAEEDGSGRDEPDVRLLAELSSLAEELRNSQ